MTAPNSKETHADEVRDADLEGVGAVRALRDVNRERLVGVPELLAARRVSSNSSRPVVQTH